MPTKNKTLVCVLCYDDILPEDNETKWDQGYNPKPLITQANDGNEEPVRCCLKCDNKVITPLRMMFGDGYSLTEVKKHLELSDDDIDYMINIIWKAYLKPLYKEGLEIFR